MGHMVSEQDVMSDLKEAVADLGPTEAHPEREFLRYATEFLRENNSRFRTPERPEPLTDEEMAALKSVGVDMGGREVMLRQAFRSASLHAASLASAIPLATAAKRLGVSASRLRQRILEGTLISLREPGTQAHRIPLFQLTDVGELPGLRTVLGAVRDDAPTLAICGFFSTPQPDLEAEEGDALTPIEWLMSGGDPAPVAELAAHI